MNKDILIITDGDRILCEECYPEGYDELDPATQEYAETDHGTCDCCGRDINGRDDED